MLSYLNGHGITSGGSGAGHYGTVWLDIEGPQYWSTTQSTNQAFFTCVQASLTVNFSYAFVFSGLVNELNNKGQTIGVYTSGLQS